MESNHLRRAHGRTRLLRVLALVTIPLALLAACKDDKSSGAGTAASSSASATASVSAAPSASIDEAAAAKYAESLKTLRERVIGYMTALQQVYAVGSKKEIDTFRSFFPPDATGEKSATEISKEAAFTGKEGLSIRKFEVNDVSFDSSAPPTKIGVAEVWEEQSQRGKERCSIYKLRFVRGDDGTYYRLEKADLKIIPCE